MASRPVPSARAAKFVQKRSRYLVGNMSQCEGVDERVSPCISKSTLAEELSTLGQVQGLLSEEEDIRQRGLARPGFLPAKSIFVCRLCR
jgi:hypothetical protein